MMGFTSSDVAVELRDVAKTFGQVRALEGVSLRVGRGEIFGYVGRNGAGKTTSIKILTGLIRPSRGDALVAGRSILERPLEAKALFGYVPESGALFEKFSPPEYLSLLGRLHGLTESVLRERCSRWFEYFDLAAHLDKPIGVLSKGTKQKICWIAALLHEPEVLFLDEPLNGLDVDAVARVKDLMVSLTARGVTVFYSSHLLDIVAKVCTRVAVLNAGRLVVTGTVEEAVAALGGSSLEQGLVGLARTEAS